ncbi:MAG: hypothetical protein R3E42_05420 [Burkholderiaceae bacterium]
MIFAGDGGGAIAAAFLYLIKRSITYRSEMTQAASRVVPWLIAAMAWAFRTYMMLKGFSRKQGSASLGRWVFGAVFSARRWALIRKPIVRMALRQDNSKDGVSRLFTWPLVLLGGIARACPWRQRRGQCGGGAACSNL